MTQDKEEKPHQSQQRAEGHEGERDGKARNGDLIIAYKV
jgi:hypothetical protein